MIFGTLYLNAQTYQTIEPIEGKGKSEYGIYYKDFNNVFNTFEGTYEYNGSDFYFKMVLKKKICVNNSDYFWKDMIIGKYQYIKDGVEINYLSDNLDEMDDVDANINSSWILTEPIFCPDCLPEKWLRGAIFDPVRNKSAWLYMAKKIQNGEEGLELWFHLEAATQQPWESDEPIQLPIEQFFVKKITD